MWDAVAESSWALPVQWGAAIGASLAAAVLDTRTLRIPNALTLPVFAGGLLWAAVSAGLSGLGEAALAAAFLGLPFLILYAFALGGAGDVKLMAGIGAWLGFPESAPVLLAVALAGAVFGAAFALARGRFGAMLTNVKALSWGFLMTALTRGRVREVGIVAGAPRAGAAFPYGLSILAGVVAAGLGTYLWRA